MDSFDQKLGMESQDSGSPVSIGTERTVFNFDKTSITLPLSSGSPSSLTSPQITPTPKGVENAKKRLRAFSIQKKSPMTPLTVPKPVSTGNTTVLIGKLTSVKVTPKPPSDDPLGEQKPPKPPKPPKPGGNKRHIQDYMDQRVKTLSEIEDMKRKMELVELGIPLGLICPSTHNYKAMPTKAMPPIKSFLGNIACECLVTGRCSDSTLLGSVPANFTSMYNSSKLDEIIVEAKKAKAEGKKFKFDYRKILPDYDNPFQRKKEESMNNEPEKKSRHYQQPPWDYDHQLNFNWKRGNKYKGNFYRRGNRGKIRFDRVKQKEEKKYRVENDNTQKERKETDVNLKDYYVCDSWSLDNEDKSNSSPKIDESLNVKDIPKPMAIESVEKEELKDGNVSKIERLQPVMDSFEYEIDLNEEELDMNTIASNSDKCDEKKPMKIDLYDSPEILKLIDENTMSKDSSDMNDDKFLQSVINEIKQDDICDAVSHEKSLVEYEVSPTRDDSQSDIRDSVTPELKSLNSSQISDYSDGYKSVESGYKSTESSYNKPTEIGYKLAENSYKSTEGDYQIIENIYKSNEDGYKSSVNVDNQFRISTERDMTGNMSKSTIDSLEIWSFVLKICQPLLFRHDRNKCYKETQTCPKLWYTENPRYCSCVKDRSIVYEELELFKMNLVDRVYGCDQIPDAPFPLFRNWYPRSSQFLFEHYQVPADDDWEVDDTQPVQKRKSRRSMTPQKNEEVYLDREYQKFMQALSDVAEQKADNSRSTTPVTLDVKGAEEKTKAKKRLSSEGWSQESDIEEEVEKSKKVKLDRVKHRKRKHSSSSVTSSSDDYSKKKKKSTKKKDSKKSKTSKRLSKKYLRKLKEKQKKKKKLMKLVQDSDDDDYEQETRRKKKSKKKKEQKSRRNKQKKKKSRAKSSSSDETSSSSESSFSETDSEDDKRSKKKKKDADSRKNKRKKSISIYQEDLFDVNILNNIKTERITDDEKQISPRKKPREIINVKELQNDFVGNNNIRIKKEAEEKMIVESNKIAKEVKSQQIEKDIEIVEADRVTEVDSDVVEVHNDIEAQDVGKGEDDGSRQNASDIQEIGTVDKKKECFKGLQYWNPVYNMRAQSRSNIERNSAGFAGLRKIEQVEESNQTTAQQPPVDESSQCSSQESSSKEIYEKDESHLRPSSQNSNYNFNDVMASQGTNYQKDLDPEEKYHEVYEQGNYEMYEQLAMAYQTELDKLDTQAKEEEGVDCERRIETVVRGRVRGEIKCDWRAGDDHDMNSASQLTNHRPSRWGLKPGEVNIVLTGGGNTPEEFPIQNVVEPQPVYKIQSLANRSDNCNISYDEAYMDTYGASDRLQYGDCFAENSASIAAAAASDSSRVKSSNTPSLDERISKALQHSVLSELAKEPEEAEEDKDSPEKGILVTKAPVVSVECARVNKRVSFADGYKPGQDSDVEEPPLKKSKRVRGRRVGCAWPCPATHPDHVPLWDALPPPPPPPGDPPTPPTHVLHTQRQHPHNKFDPALSLLNFMPPEPLPGIITF